MPSGLYLPGPGSRPGQPVIGPQSPEALIGPGGVFMCWSNSASAAWPAADRAYGYPFMLSEPQTLLQMYVYNGATASGNVDVGIYLPDGTKVVSKGSTAQSGTSGWQLFDLTDTVLQPYTLYYAWCCLSSATGTVFRWAGGVNVGQVIATGIVQMAAATGGTGSLPATVTPAAMATNYLPDFGMVFASTI